MYFRRLRRALLWAAVVGTGAAAIPNAWAGFPGLGRPKPNYDMPCPCPLPAYQPLPYGPCPGPPAPYPPSLVPKDKGELTPKDKEEVPPALTPELTAAPAPAALPPISAGAFPGATVAVSPNMQGHQLGIPALAFTTRTGQFAERGAVLYPSIRYYQVCDNESPRPTDRVYAGFNFFDKVNEAVNLRAGSDVSDLKVYHEYIGLEKTFLDGNASIGLRLPFNTLSGDSTVPGLGGTSTDVGDLTTILKWAPFWNRDTGSLLSTGLAVTAPTGPRNFAGSESVVTFHNTLLQPFVGYILSGQNFFVQGFSSVIVPTSSEDVTLLANDIALGYYLYRTGCACRWVSSIVPTFEVHVNNPLNHRGALNFFDPAGTADVVAFTMGTTVEFRQRATLAVGFVVPATGPRPYDYEILAQFNWRFGRSVPSRGVPAFVLGN